jgi:hypothetical protein
VRQLAKVLVPAAATAPAAAPDTPRTAEKLDTRTRVAECRIRKKTALAAVADPLARTPQRSRVQFAE